MNGRATLRLGAAVRSAPWVLAITSVSTNIFASHRRRPRSDDPTAPALLEFQWPSTAVANAPIPRTARGIVWIVASLVAALLTLAGLIPVDQVVTTRGLVVSQSPNILVQPLETAIVRSIEVREGQRVQKGQVLARLDPTFATADLTALAAQVSTLEAEVARGHIDGLDIVPDRAQGGAGGFGPGSGGGDLLGEGVQFFRHGGSEDLAVMGGAFVDAEAEIFGD